MMSFSGLTDKSLQPFLEEFQNGISKYAFADLFAKRLFIEDEIEAWKRGMQGSESWRKMIDVSRSEQEIKRRIWMRDIINCELGKRLCL